MRPGLLLIALLIGEIVLFVEIGGLIGAWTTVALVLLAAVAGVLILRRGGMRTLAQVQTALQAGRDPGREMFEGSLMLFAALLLILPGFLSDVMALLLLVPPLRGWLYRRLSGRWQGSGQAPLRAADQVIEGEFVEVPSRGDNDPRPPSGWTQH